MEGLKRKRDDDVPRITYHAAGRTFDRLFKEKSLEETKEVVRRKLELSHDAVLRMKQMRGGKAIDLDDDDDFDAFSALVRNASSVDVHVTVASPKKQSHTPRASKNTEVPVLTPTVALPRPPEPATDTAQNRDVLPVVSNTTGPSKAPSSSRKKRKVSFDDTPDPQTPKPRSSTPSLTKKRKMNTDRAKSLGPEQSDAEVAPMPKKRRSTKKSQSVDDTADGVEAISVVDKTALAKEQEVTPVTVSDPSSSKAAVAKTASDKKSKKPRKTSSTKQIPPLAEPLVDSNVLLSGAQDTPDVPLSVSSEGILPSEPPKARKRTKKSDKIIASANKAGEGDGPTINIDDIAAEVAREFQKTVTGKAAGKTPRPSEIKKKDKLLPVDEGVSENTSLHGASSSLSKRRKSLVDDSKSEVEVTKKSKQAKRKAEETETTSEHADTDVPRRKKKAPLSSPDLRSSFAAVDAAIASVLQSNNEEPATPSPPSGLEDPARSSRSDKPVRKRAKPKSKVSQVPDSDVVVAMPPAVQTTVKTPCPVCLTSPFHLRYQCPVILAGSDAMQKRLEELENGDKRDHARLIEELQELIRDATAQESTSTAPNGLSAGISPRNFTTSDTPEDVGSKPIVSSSTSDKHSSSWPSMVRTGQISEVTVESRDEGSSSEGSDDDEDNDGPSDPTEQDRMNLAALDHLSLAEVDLDELIRGPGKSKSILQEILSSSTSDHDDEDEKDKLLDEEKEDRDYRRFSKKFDKTNFSSDEESQAEASPDGEDGEDIPFLSEPPSEAVDDQDSGNFRKSTPPPDTLPKDMGGKESSIITGEPSLEAPDEAATTTLQKKSANTHTDQDIMMAGAAESSSSSTPTLNGQGMDALNSTASPEPGGLVTLGGLPDITQQATPDVTGNVTVESNQQNDDNNERTEVVKIGSEAVKGTTALCIPSPAPVGRPKILSIPEVQTTVKSLAEDEDGTGSIVTNDTDSFNRDFGNQLSSHSTPKPGVAHRMKTRGGKAGTDLPEAVIRDSSVLPSTRRSSRQSTAATNRDVVNAPRRTRSATQRALPPKATKPQQSKKAGQTRESAKTVQKDGGDAAANATIPSTTVIPRGSAENDTALSPPPPPSLQQWATLREPSSPLIPDSSIAIDELQPSSSALSSPLINKGVTSVANGYNVTDNEDVDDTLKNHDPLFILTESQVPFPYSQWNEPAMEPPTIRTHLGSPSSSESESEQTTMGRSQRNQTQKSTIPYRSLTEIASQQVSFSSDIPASLQKISNRKVTNAYTEDSDGEEDTSSESGSEDGGTPSHIPESKRAGSTRKKKAGLLNYV